jgi:hypothetical protein
LAIFAVVTAISLITASSGSLVIPVFAVKRNTDKNGSTSSGSSSTSKKDPTSKDGTTTGSEKQFFKCVTAIPGGAPSRIEVDKCWDQVFGSSGSTLGSSITGKNSGVSSGQGGVSNLGKFVTVGKE